MAYSPLTRIGGSSAERVIRCPGSVALCAVAPKAVESAEARDGTIAHKLAETCIREGLDPIDMIGRTIEHEERKYEVSEGMADAVTVYVNHVRTRYIEKNKQSDIDRLANLHLEAKVSLDVCGPLVEGTTDLYHYDPVTRTLEVCDYKHGAGVAVEIENNAQLKFYALAAFYAVSDPIEKIVLHVVQPQCEHVDGPIRTNDQITPLELVEFGIEFAAAVDVARKPNAPRCPGKWCQFCDASGVCPDLYKVAQEACELEIQDDDSSEITDYLDCDEIGRRLRLLEPLQHWISGIKRYARAEALRGRPPTGYKLVRVKGRRKFVNPEQVMQEASIKYAIPEDRLFTKKPLSVAQFEKLGGRGALKKSIEKFIEGHLEAATRAVSLVTESDRREAVEPDIDLEFADLLENNNE